MKKTTHLVLLICTGMMLPCLAQGERTNIAVSASSTLTPSATSDFSPENLIDGSDASWSEGAKGPGVGEYIEIDFRYPDHLNYIFIRNGFGNSKYWEANCRIKQMKISNENGDYRLISLEDTPDSRVYGLNTFFEDDGLLSFEESLYGNSFKFEILDIYPGSKWEDACIAELNFNQWYTSTFTMKDEYIFKNLYRVYYDGIFDLKGELYIESDWDGYINLSVDGGYHFEEIASGDGMEGYREQQAYINKSTGSYYLLIVDYSKDLDYEHIDFNEEVQDAPVWIETFRWEFIKYDPSKDKFISREDNFVDELFIESPSKVLGNLLGEIVNLKDLWVQYAEPGFIKAVYPATHDDPKAEANYYWDGNFFRLQE